MLDFLYWRNDSLLQKEKDLELRKGKRVWLIEESLDRVHVLALRYSGNISPTPPQWCEGMELDQLQSALGLPAGDSAWPRT